MSVSFIYVCVHPRGRLFAASFRRWQAFGSGPHVGLMLTHSPDHTQLGDVSCMEYIVTPHTQADVVGLAV